MKNFKTLYKEYANLNPAFSVGGSSTGPGMSQYKPTADLNLRAAKKKKRNYRKEYDNYQSKPEQIEKRSSRNKASRFMGVKKGMDVHHKDNNPLNNDPKNLEYLDISTNRREPRLREKSQKWEAEVSYQYMTFRQGRRKHYTAYGKGNTKQQAIDNAMKIYKSDRNVKRGSNAEVDKVVTKKI